MPVLACCCSPGASAENQDLGRGPSTPELCVGRVALGPQAQVGQRPGCDPWTWEGGGTSICPRPCLVPLMWQPAFPLWSSPPRVPPGPGLLGVRPHFLLPGRVARVRLLQVRGGWSQLPPALQVAVYLWSGGPLPLPGTCRPKSRALCDAGPGGTDLCPGRAGWPPPGSLASQRPRVTCPGPAEPGVQRPRNSARGPHVYPVTLSPPGQRPHRTIAPGPGTKWEQGVCCGGLHLCALQNWLPVSGQLCQVTRSLRGRAGIVTGDLLGDCSQRRESSLLVPTRPRTQRGSHGGDARPRPVGQAGQPWAPRPCDLNAASDGDPGGCPPRPSRVTHAGGAWRREGCVSPAGHRAAGWAWSP